jgi:hypothetical protein
MASRQSFPVKGRNGESNGGVSGTDLAGYADGGPFLQSRRMGKGLVFVCTTLPQSDWSSLSEGTVLVPMIQRMIRAGNERLGQAQTAVCGEWKPAFDQDLWMPADATTPKDYRWQAGVYQCGTRRVALNRPDSEDLPEVVEKDRLRQLFGDTRIRFVEETLARDTGQIQSEVWYWLVCLALAAMAGESFLLTGGAAWRRSGGDRTSDGNERT